MSNQTTAHNINWKIRGPNWTLEFEAPQDSDPMELFTHCLEQVWGEVEGWKLSNNETSFQGQLTTNSQEAPKLSVLLMLENSKMRSKKDHLVVSTPLVLANAGLHNEAARLERSWDITPEEIRLRTIVEILEG